MLRHLLERGPVVLSVVASFTSWTAADAATLHHWRFENSPGFLQDSAGGAHLTASPAASQYALPVSGVGASFVGPFANVGTNESAVAFNGTDSAGLAAANTTPASGDFTVELFFHAQSLNGSFGDALVSQAGGLNAPDVGWSLQLRLDGFADSQPGELVLFLSDGVTFHAPLSGIIIEPTVDYFIAASFDRAAGQVIYRVQDLTNGTPLETATAAHSVAALNQVSAFRIGDVANTLATHGIIDEVRFSDQVLSTKELLVSPIPEPGMLLLAAIAITAARLIRRRRNDH
jgi:hypothetical protein